MYLAAKKLGRYQFADSPTTAIVLQSRRMRRKVLMSVESLIDCALAQIRTGPERPRLSHSGILARIFHQDAKLWRRTGRDRSGQPIDHSIGKTGMPDMSGQNPPESGQNSSS